MYAATAEGAMIFAGDTVEIRHPQPQDVGRVYRVLKVNPKNLRVEDEEGRRFTGPHHIWRKTDRPFTKPATAAEEVSIPELFDIGEVVRVPHGVNSGKWAYTKDQLFVVIKQGPDRVNIVKLGGDGGRYWRMDPSSLERVPAASVRIPAS